MKVETISGWTGYFNNFIKKSLDAGKETPESKNRRFKRIIEEEKRKVLPIYNTNGKIIEYDNSGRHLDVNA